MAAVASHLVLRIVHTSVWFKPMSARRPSDRGMPPTRDYLVREHERMADCGLELDESTIVHA
jgi:hypothetical protein